MSGRLNTPGLGVIAPGSTADLLIVESNPLDSLAALRTPWRVLRRGTVVSRRDE